MGRILGLILLVALVLALLVYFDIIAFTPEGQEALDNAQEAVGEALGEAGDALQEAGENASGN